MKPVRLSLKTFERPCFSKYLRNESLIKNRLRGLGDCRRQALSRSFFGFFHSVSLQVPSIIDPQGLSSVFPGRLPGGKSLQYRDLILLRMNISDWG